MKAADEPIGADNDRWLCQLANQASIVIAAWGTYGAHQSRGDVVRWMLTGKLHYLRLTSEGCPGHPLYLPANLKPVLWQ